MKIGVVDVGGGFRGIYACGVLDYCLDENICFDLGIGVSAGSANLASFIAGQRGRNYLFYTKYGFRKQYASLRNFILKRSYIDMDYVYGTLSDHDGENPLDYAALRENSVKGSRVLGTPQKSAKSRPRKAGSFRGKRKAVTSG